MLQKNLQDILGVVTLIVGKDKEEEEDEEEEGRISKCAGVVKPKHLATNSSLLLCFLPHHLILVWEMGVGGVARPNIAPTVAADVIKRLVCFQCII